MDFKVSDVARTLVSAVLTLVSRLFAPPTESAEMSLGAAGRSACATSV